MSEQIQLDDWVINQLKKDIAQGFSLPHGYNYINAVKASYRMLTGLKFGKEKNYALYVSVVSSASIVDCLIKMAYRGLDASKGQISFVPKGTELTLSDAYFGNILQVKRIYPAWTPSAHSVRQGDVFEYTTDPNTGYTKLVRHEQKLENRYNEIVGGYVYMPTADGDRDLFVMTIEEIKTAWMQQRDNTLSVHKKFPEKMVGKTLINSACQTIIKGECIGSYEEIIAEAEAETETGESLTAETEANTDTEEIEI